MCCGQRSNFCIIMQSIFKDLPRCSVCSSTLAVHCRHNLYVSKLGTPATVTLLITYSSSSLSTAHMSPNGDDFRAFLGHHEIFCPLILSHHEIHEAVTSIFFHCIHISLPDPNSNHTTFVCNRNIPFYSPPTCISFFSSTTLMFTVTFWNTSKLSSDESVTVLDAVALSAINNATSNFLGDCLITVEVFSITSYPLPWWASLTLQFSSATAMFFWWWSFSFRYCIPWNPTSQIWEVSSTSKLSKNMAFCPFFTGNNVTTAPWMLVLDTSMSLIFSITSWLLSSAILTLFTSTLHAVPFYTTIIAKS